MAASNKKKIPVEELQIGMFVVDLDRPWLETPFPFQGFAVVSQREIDALSKYCREVYIDIEQSIGADTRGRLSAGSAAGTGSLPIQGETVYKELTPVEQEMLRAREIYAECENVLRDTLAALKAGGELDADRLKGAVTGITGSISRNPDAMLLLAKLKQKGDYELKRALDTSVLMITFGRFLQLAPEQLDTLGLVGLLQDIGKIRIPEDILRKRGPLTAEEYETAKSHVVLSAEILRAAAGLPGQLAGLVLLHHERHDGSGYPRGLIGNAIGLVGSIAAIVDRFSALTSIRPYAEQLSPSNALGSLYNERGGRFHEALVEQFVQCIGIYPVGSVVELNTGEIGIVIAQNRVRRLQPRVMVILDNSWKPVQPQVLLDLLKEPRASDGEPYRIRRTIESSKLPLDPRDFFL